jgi:predicted nucleotidyltransferase
MNYGLTEKELAWLLETVITPLKKQGAHVYIFGSRARGTHQRFSDIDILVDTKDDLTSLISAIAEECENSNFPYKIDIVEDRSLADSFRPSVLADRVRL